VPAAEAAKREGILVVAVCARTASSDCGVMERLASGPEAYFEVDLLDRVLEQLVLVGLRLRQVTVTEATLIADLPVDAQLVTGSTAPAAEPLPGGRLRWRFADPSPLGVRARYSLRPLRAGRQPVAVWADARFTDALGRAGYRAYDVPEVEPYSTTAQGPCRVELETRIGAGPVSLSQIVPITRTASFVCPPSPVDLDTVLAIDHSSSMGTFDRLESARAAAHAYLDELDPRHDRVGLVAFSDAVTDLVPLGDDFDAVRQVVDGLAPDGRTSLAVALREAHALFLMEPRQASRAIVLLTDGRTQGSMASVLAAADAAKADSILIVTFCAGSCDPELALVASRPDLAVTVADSAQLVALYRELAAQLSEAKPADVTIEQALPDALEPEPGSAWPAPAEGPSVARTLWRLDLAPDGTVAAGMTLRSLRAGRMPVGQAWLSYRLGPSGHGHARFPDPELVVVGPQPATPTPILTPTSTPWSTAGPSATTTPTPDGRPPRAAYLPSTGR
jgi:hypothetical protein